MADAREPRREPRGKTEPDLPHARGLGEILESFDRYQVAVFPERPAAFFALELAGECGELANLEKKLWRKPGDRAPEETLADEAADVFIALANYCNARGIDLQRAVDAKLEVIDRRRRSGRMGP